MFQKVQNAVRRGALALTVSVVSMSAAQGQTLSDALATAYEHSGLLEQNRALLRAADEDVAISQALLRPIINWFGNVNYDYGRNGAGSVTTAVGWTPYANIGVSADLLLFDNGNSKLAVEAAKESVLATRQALVSVEQSVLFNAVQAFMDVVSDDELVKLRQNNLRLLERELQAAQDRFEVGEVTRTDVALAEARLAGARAQLAAARGDLDASKEFYAAAIGERPSNLVTPRSLPKAAGSVDQAKTVAVRSHPQMLQAQYQISASEINVERARAAMGPTVTLKTSVGTRRDFDSSVFSDSARVGVELGGPIYQGGRLSALLRQSMARRDAERANLHVVRHSIRQNAGTAWARLIAAGAQIQASARQVEASRIAF
jgi:outer membrane protein